MIIFLFQKIKDRKSMRDFAIGLTDACWAERKEIKRRVRRITGWQGWKNVIVSMRIEIEEGRHYKKSPGASNYLEVDQCSHPVERWALDGGEVRGGCFCDPRKLCWVESYVARANRKRTA